MSSPLKGALLGLAGFGLFSVADATIKFLGDSYHAFQIVAFASLFTLPLIGLLWLRNPVSLRPVHPWLMAIRTVALIGNALLVTYTFTVLPLAQAYAIFFTLPLVLTLLAWPLLGDRVDAVGGVAVVLGLIGVIVALNPGRVEFGFGHVTAILGMLLAAVHYLIVRRTGGVESSVAMLLYPVAGQALAAFLILPGRYIIQPEVMKILETQEKGAGGEIQLTDAMASMIGQQPFHGVTFDGRRFDCGSKAGYIEANLALALDRTDLNNHIRKFALTELGLE